MSIILAFFSLGLGYLPINRLPVERPPAPMLIGAAALQTVPEWHSANSEIGPLQTQRIFYKGAPPTSYAGSYCSELRAGITCIVSYKTQTTNVASYVKSIPPGRKVIFIFHHEPENDTFSGPGTNGQNFVSDFEAQSSLIRSSARGAANIKVAMAAEAFQYQPGTRWDNGGQCGYIPPVRYVDYYLADIYEPDPSGRDLPHSVVRTQWDTWLGCVKAANQGAAHPAALGIAEYGLGTLAGNTVREETMAADNTYLKRILPIFGLWEYWWEDNSIDGGCTASNCDWQFTDPATVREWQKIEGGSWRL
jgi:hypothetical protein